jgi:L-fuculose-phosphate aldolase
VLELDGSLEEALDGLEPGDTIQVLYWMHKLTEDQRRIRRVHPRGDTSRPVRGVFALRSPMRPNPIGVSNVRMEDMSGTEIFVTGLDALDGSPVLDIKISRETGKRKYPAGD